MSTHEVHAAILSQKVSRHISITARRLSRMSVFADYQAQDIEQEIILHVLANAERFDPSRSCVETFISLLVNTAAKMLIRSCNAQKRSAFGKLPSIDQSQIDLPSQEDCFSTADKRIDVTDALQSLPPRKRQIAAMLADGNEHSISLKIKKSRRQVRKDISFIQEHLRSCGLDAYASGRTITNP